MVTESTASDEKPVALNCPKCGRLLHFHASRAESDSDGQPDPVYVYLCYVDGFFTFTNRKGLKDAL